MADKDTTNERPEFWEIYDLLVYARPDMPEAERDQLAHDLARWLRWLVRVS